ncbi:hypothetical protein ACWD4B_04755 [Streptomyces sp. NPDC002536]
MASNKSAKMKHHSVKLAASVAVSILALSGCGDVKKSSDLGYTPETQEIDAARKTAKELSSEILDAISLKGRVSGSGPGVSRCDEDPDHLYKIRHAWSVWGVPEEEMQRSLERLKDELPKRGWKVVRYGRDSSQAKNIEMVADSTKSKFSANITFMDKRGVKEASPQSSSTSGIMVDLVSACFRVPQGKTVDEY